jgi:outer membrane immunogenic protein
MKPLLLATIAFAAAFPAAAADLSAFRPGPSSAFVWSGPYVGGNLGGAHAQSDFTQSDPLGDVERGTFSPSGLAGGAQGGYNWLLSSNWLIGFEADVMGGDLNACQRQAEIA